MSRNQGIRSKNVRHVTAPKVEPRAHARNPAAVAQYGALVGSHVTNKGDTGYRGDPDYVRSGYNNPVGPTNMALSGPGAGKNKIMPSGGQGRHGPVNPGNTPPNRYRDALEQE